MPSCCFDCEIHYQLSRVVETPDVNGDDEKVEVEAQRSETTIEVQQSNQVRYVEDIDIDELLPEAKLEEEENKHVSKPYVTIMQGRCSEWLKLNCTGGDSGTEPYLTSHYQLLAHAAAANLYKTKYQVLCILELP
ncbi:hypothetical protein RIF29_10704 [Crotalaria pallida]|uniref:Uncharacterized protein n=1 Tax=Crotalaria pallida TaxID=3830 RepID=A0AAN9FZ55_CROPI